MPRHLDRFALGVVLAIVLAACTATVTTPSPSSQPSQAATPSSTAAATSGPTAAESTPLDGKYQTSFTRDELAASTTDPEEINDQNWGEFTLTFSDGRVAFTQRNDLGSSSTSGVFTVQGDAVTFAFDTGVNKGETFGFRWSFSGGTLTLVRDESVGIGPTPFLVKPWTTVP